jgi:hypothetical protein
MSDLAASPFVDRMILFLMPYFLFITPDRKLARAEALATLESYGARSRSQVLAAVQVVAFGFSALDLLAEAKATEMSPAMRLRFRACANSLNRSGQQTEKALTKSLACDAPDIAEPAAEEINETLRQVQAHIEATRNSLSGPAKPTQPRRPTAVFNAIFADPPPPN